MSRINYAKLVPPESFLGRYLAYMQEQETPIAYDFWCGISLIGAVIGRDLVVGRPRIPVRLNTFILLVADSGLTRKSSAIYVARSIARMVLPETTLQIETKMSPEMLELQLQRSTAEYGSAHAYITISELTTFLGRERYAQAMPGLLTDLYDCAETKSGGGTVARGPGTIKNIYVSFLSASTPVWLVRTVNPDVVEGGFTSRCLFIVQEKPKKAIPWPDEGGIPKQSIADELIQIRDKAAMLDQISITPAALERFKRWYKRRPVYHDTYRNTFQSREDEHILRLAAFLSINEGMYDIQVKHILPAIAIIDEVREDGASIFLGGAHASNTILAIDRVREKLIEAGLNGRTQSELTQLVRNLVTAEVVKTALSIMHELGMVQCFQNVQVAKGRPKTIWRATNKITARNAIDLVTEKMEPER